MSEVGCDQAVVHLYSNEGYDESEFWCDESEFWCAPGEPAMTPYFVGQPIHPTREPHKATCKRCLSAAASYGEAAMVRLREVTR